MKARINSAHVLALIAIVLAVGGNAVAFTLGKNSVGTKQLKRGAVTKQKVRKNAINGSKVKNNSLTGADINLSKLGTVPSATNAAAANTANLANSASVATSLTPAEPWHEVGAPGEPAFQNEWQDSGFNLTTQPETVAFYRDHEGIVHLRGLAEKGSEELVFQLPPGYRPAANKVLEFAVRCTCSNVLGVVEIFGASSVPSIAGDVFAPSGASDVTFDGITFRAES